MYFFHSRAKPNRGFIFQRPLNLTLYYAVQFVCYPCYALSSALFMVGGSTRLTSGNIFLNIRQV
nr:MAG TPA: hypothetical protein [Caudoviricetes sp.]